MLSKKRVEWGDLGIHSRWMWPYGWLLVSLRKPPTVLEDFQSLQSLQYLLLEGLTPNTHGQHGAVAWAETKVMLLQLLPYSQSPPETTWEANREINNLSLVLHFPKDETKTHYKKPWRFKQGNKETKNCFLFDSKNSVGHSSLWWPMPLWISQTGSGSSMFPDQNIGFHRG